MTTKKQRMYERIENHGADLLKIFPAAKITDPVKLCKALRRIESAVSLVTTSYCNGHATEEQTDAACDNALAKLESLLSFTCAGVPVIINRDPRGYAIKIDSPWVRGYTEKGGRIHRDWGGYGIIAPDLTND